jgi:ActR/RegA family two-component response regulator
MPEILEGPLVLIIDDDEEFRDDIGPAFVRQRLKGRVITAKDVKSGINYLNTHDAHGEDPIDLAIVDMHMPRSEDSIDTDERAGILYLGFTLRYMKSHCATVIFTAYPTYENCVEAVKNGAYDYIPKMTESGEKSNLDLLEAACNKALSPREDPKHEVPSSDWLARNYKWLCDQYGGKCVVLVAEEQAKAAGLISGKSEKVRDGLFVIFGDSYPDVRQQINVNSVLWQKASAIAPLPKPEAK